MIWIMFNEYREVMGVYDNKTSANKSLEIYNEMAAASIFTLEEHEIEK